MNTESNVATADFGMIGLGVMGRNLAQNIEDKGFEVAVWNLEGEWTDKFVGGLEGKRFVATKSLKELVASLSRPRKLMLMVTAGKAVDSVIGQLEELLEPGDIIIDGGNTWYLDTAAREERLRARGILFFGVGVSGGEEGARYGPSLMPGGDKEAYQAIRPIFEAIAAKTTSGACVTHIGPRGAGHFVKTVHNGIEYADMQLIAEAYDLLHRGFGVENEELASIFDTWNQGKLESFLIEITAEIFKHKDAETGTHTVDLVLDRAGQKGTGRWTCLSALELGVPVPTIQASLEARGLSALKEERVAASDHFRDPKFTSQHDKAQFIQLLHDGLYAAKICAYAQGLDLIGRASDESEWGVDLGEVARIWKGGCIIRARFLDEIRTAFADGERPANMLVSPVFAEAMAEHVPALRQVVAFAVQAGIAVPAMSASLAYFDSYRTADLPQNLTQAQRDAFGAHTFIRIDRPEDGAQHVDWI